MRSEYVFVLPWQIHFTFSNGNIYAMKSKRERPPKIQVCKLHSVVSSTVERQRALISLLSTRTTYERGALRLQSESYDNKSPAAKATTKPRPLARLLQPAEYNYKTTERLYTQQCSWFELLYFSQKWIEFRKQLLQSFFLGLFD